MNSYRDFVCLVATALLLWGCPEGNGTTPPGSSPASTGATAIMASSVDIRGVNEPIAESTELHNALFRHAFFLQLLEEQIAPETGMTPFKPLLAESWELSEDRLTLDFHLRRDVVWSDGVPVTAEDVVWTYEVQTSPDVAWVNAEAKQHITKVEALDPLTVRFHFERAYGTQVLDANEGVILPKHAWSALPLSEWRTKNDWFVDNLVVSGPFTLESWKPGESIVLKRNERYFRAGYPRLERLILRIVPDQLGQLALLRAGEVHATDWARPSDAKALLEDPEIELLSHTVRAFYALTWNTRLPYFSNAALRRALAHAIDRRTIIDSLYDGYAKLTESPYASDLWVYNKKIEPRGYDPQKARDIFAAEGWSDTDGDGVRDKDGVKFSFEILTLAGNELRQDILVLVQEDLVQVGIEVTQRAVEFNTLLDMQRSHQCQASFMSLVPPTNFDIGFFVHSDEIEHGFNFAAYSNPEVDRRIEELRQQIDPMAAKPLYDEIQELLFEEQPATFLYEATRLIPVRKNLRQMNPNSLSIFYHVHEWELVNGS